MCNRAIYKQSGIKCGSVAATDQGIQAKLESNSELERAIESQRVAVRGGGSQSGTHIEPESSLERQGENQ